ncbi:MAG: VIT and VWA domain-containing protein [Planctomycetes bacterium]|nr:VIT and VWA domain-containing protein [Planctomycetota bacterium]
MRCLAGLSLLLATGGAVAQEQAFFRGAAHVVVPQRRSFSLRHDATPIAIERVRARVTIDEQAAGTALEVTVRNTSSAPAEAVLLLPVPDGAAIHSFAFEGPAREPTAELLPREEARRTYSDIVRSLRDPALLEFAGYALVRSSVFPVPAQGTQRVRIVYNHLLPAVDSRVDYVLPRSESLDVDVPWEIEVDATAKAGIGMAYSPTHEIETDRAGPGHVKVRTTASASRSPGPFRLSLLSSRDSAAATLFAYPDPRIGGGYFLLVAGLPPAAKREPRREVTIVLDRSGSMAGPKMDQARAAALQIVEGLLDGEAFNLVDFGNAVSLFADRPVVKDRAAMLRAREYLHAVRPIGGTNTYDALVEALRQPTTAGLLPTVLFLTDGLPTVGRTGEPDIRALVESGNPHRRRVFTFGLGDDVNAPLLDRLAEASRAAAVYVRPGEDLEEPVLRAFERLKGPVLADGRLSEANGAILGLQPATLPDLFEGDQLVVLGQYKGSGPLKLALDGAERSLSLAFGLDGATTRNAFVPRLWAARRIAELVDRVRQTDETSVVCPEHRALIEEIVRLSAEWGILSEYTAFFAREGTDLSDWDAINFRVMAELAEKAVKARCGTDAVDRAQVLWAQKKQSVLDGRNLLDDKIDRAGLAAVQQASDRALFCRGKQWIDGRIVAGRSPVAPDATIECGTPEFERLVDALVAEDRQGLLAVRGEILLRLDGRNVLVRNDW